MSMLNDALQRAQGDEAKILAQSGEESAKATKASPRSKTWPYAIAGLLLLSAGSGWYIFQLNQYTAISTSQSVSSIKSGTMASAASQPIAASSVEETIAALPATASGANSATHKPWTHPATAKHPHPKKRTLAKPTTPPRPDPLAEAYQSLSEGNVDQAEIKYLAVLLQHPHEKDALLGIAVIAQRKLQTERAIALYRQVLREDMGNAAAAAGLVSLSALADPLAAESQLRELLIIKPTSAEFHYALGGVLARQQRWSEAQQAFFRAYSLAPEKPLYAYNLAVCLDHLRLATAAILYYEKAVLLAKPSDTTINRDVVAIRIQELENSR